MIERKVLPVKSWDLKLGWVSVDGHSGISKDSGVCCSNGNSSETKANESFDIEAKWTPSIVSKLFSKRSEHIRKNKNYFPSEANTFDSKETILKAKRTPPTTQLIFRSEANTIDRERIIFEAKLSTQ